MPNGYENVNLGTAANNQSGDPARVAFDKLNNADNYLYSLIESLQTAAANYLQAADIANKADLDPLTGKLQTSQLPDLAVTKQVAGVTETTIDDFAANSANYEFEQGDMVPIIDVDGNLRLYMFAGGDSANINDYIAVNATEIAMANVVGLLDALNLKLDQDQKNVVWFGEYHIYKHPGNTAPQNVAEPNDILHGWFSANQFIKAVYHGGDLTDISNFTILDEYEF